MDAAYFLEWKSIGLYYELSLTCGDSINYYENVHHPISTRENREHPGIFQNKSVISAFNWVSTFSSIKHNSSILFLGQTLYTFVKSSPLKCKFLRFLSARVKIRQISHVNFELTSQFIFRLCIILYCHDT